MVAVAQVGVCSGYPGSSSLLGHHDYWFWVTGSALLVVFFLLIVLMSSLSLSLILIVDACIYTVSG
ncbi:hypothetical protein K435DRAFT_865328 [Dendrothele bispora CBS 962.96]|uniref:Uncharacterized protein n=1 Tax=Dendrothele bispora (strain CBS 962.96) TaxID=1314807 RepID=A0A4S8LJR3_DENBC|nr:hypothetical protein K435DRAFT_865328 [Dendrothele bispora CBS 962.96]